MYEKEVLFVLGAPPEAEFWEGTGHPLRVSFGKERGNSTLDRYIDRWIDEY